MATSTRCMPSPVTRPAHSPSTMARPSSARPSSVKNAMAASRSSTTMPTLSMRLTVMTSSPACHSSGNLRLPVNLGASFTEFLRHLLHAAFLLFELRGVIAYLLRDFHGAEFRAAHGTEMRDLVTFLRQGLV